MPTAAVPLQPNSAKPADTKPFDRLALLGPHSLSMTNYSNRCTAVLADDSFRLVAVAQHAAAERLLRSRADSEDHHWAFFCTARTDTATVVTRGQRRLKGAWSLSPHSMGDHHGIRCSRRSSRALE